MSAPMGIFGGTFDPIHHGHLRPAIELHESLSLCETRFVPAGTPPHRGTPAAAADDRLAMVRLAVAGQSGFVVDERELRRSGPSYMVETLASLRREEGERPLCLLLGTDAFLDLPGWHRWEELIGLAHLVVAHRPGWTLDGHGGGPAATLWQRHRAERPQQLRQAPAGRVLLHPVSQLDISATRIRELVARRRSIRYLVPDAVCTYIDQHGLYRQALHGN